MAATDRSSPPPAKAVVSRTVLRQQIKELLLERILAHQYAPGDRLVETRIAQELGVSQAPVREALRELETLRFVESAPFKGAWVREVSDAELAEIYPIRAALEDVAARAAAERLAGKVAPLEREVRRMAKAKDLHEQVEHDVRFHRLIVEASANARLIELWGSLQVEARTMITALRTGLDPVDIAKRHEPIVDALRLEDADAAGQEIRRHVEDFGRMFMDSREIR
ncbi:GntR family transcriptional regulator [Candidatus Solirubrobacter pratensis]|jgi:DNA-binding GntR family transcriptional regulator|uniref:GntR family transcriptional regulator n=1 Tax=Candidatus Solirubrobacter pratensis TaxID=1298857 RepID=UPI000687BBC9|nr:GntR family transcriptional regulator [Candidatus Solirubrobacter pratensis]